MSNINFNSVTIFQCGDTIRFRADFYDFDDTLIDPDVVKFKLYDSNYTIISEITLGSVNKISTGKYFYDYLSSVDDKDNIFIAEMYGEINSNVSIIRDAFGLRLLN